jgi:hypothetical protein
MQGAVRIVDIVLQQIKIVAETTADIQNMNVLLVLRLCMNGLEGSDQMLGRAGPAQDAFGQCDRSVFQCRVLKTMPVSAAMIHPAFGCKRISTDILPVFKDTPEIRRVDHFAQCVAITLVKLDKD